MRISDWSSDVCSSDLFDIDAHPWGAEAGELECRLARTMIDATLHPVPAGFIAALGILPPENEPVLAIRVSGYTCCTFELLTARYMPTYRPRSPWRDISNDAVADSGGDRSEEHTSELQSLMRHPYDASCWT